MDKNHKQLESFAQYCKAHPEQRFWQALRNWAGVPFILKANKLDILTMEFDDVKDTFYDK